MRRAFVLVVLALAACGGPAEKAPDAPVSSGPALPAPAPAARPEPVATDQCGADVWRPRLVGAHRSTISATPEGAEWRVHCTTCPVTEEFRPQRMNIAYDEASGIVKSVNCG
ncbi:MAG TPA: peptidase inhibitor I78 [Caulobacteraceae bacterium]|nr:peptidase inhibitor I78 [Caulobacteraceae bacterium]